MQQLSLYSGNLSDVPFGQNITNMYNPDPADYVRIWTELSVSTPSGLPNMWVFILAIVGVLLLVITSTCFFMHFTWRRRRISLRRRVRNGDVNLEAMGIKRLTVPLSHVEKFPLFTYHYEPAAATSPPTSPTTSPRPRRRSGTREASQNPMDNTVPVVNQAASSDDGPPQPGRDVPCRERLGPPTGLYDMPRELRESG